MVTRVLRPGWSLAALVVALLLCVAAAMTAPAPGQSIDAALSAGSSSASRTSAETERRGQEALDSLNYPWRDLGYRIEFRDYQGGRLGSANSRSKRIVIFVKRGQSQQSLRITIAHELGHALDFEHATARRRDDYRIVRRIDRSAAWYPCDGCSDYRSHAGDWSEVFAYWLAGPGDFRSQVAPAPTAEQLRRLEPLFGIPRRQASPPASPRPSPRPSPSPTSLPGLVVPSATPLPAPPVDPAPPAVEPSVDVCLPVPPGLPSGAGVPHVPAPDHCAGGVS